MGFVLGFHSFFLPRVMSKFNQVFSIFSGIWQAARLPVQFNMEGSENAEGGEDVDEEGDMMLETAEYKCPDVDLCTQTMVSIHKKALQNIKVAQGRQKKYYDLKHCTDRGKYKVGALVLLKNSKKLSRKGSKLEPNWTGPYCIHEVVGKGLYRLRSSTNSTRVLSRKYNITRLKLYKKQAQSKVTITLVVDMIFIFFYSLGRRI